MTAGERDYEENDYMKHPPTVVTLQFMDGWSPSVKPNLT